jgi:ferredoxin-NADP reductase
MPDTPQRKRAFDTYDLTLVDTREIAPRNKHLRFALPAGKELGFHAGQYAQLFIPHEGGVRRRAYSIASSPWHSDYFELCVTLVDGGISSTYLHNMKVGDKIQGMVPLGHFLIKDESRDFVFIATGSGVAPFRAMIHDMAHRNLPRDLYLIYGHRYEPDIIYRQEWEDLAKRYSRFHPLFTLSRDTNWKGERGYVQEKIAGFVPNLKEKAYYICGLNNMITAVNDRLLSLGVPKEQIFFERYD